MRHGENGVRSASFTWVLYHNIFDLSIVFYIFIKIFFCDETVRIKKAKTAFQGTLAFLHVLQKMSTNTKIRHHFSNLYSFQRKSHQNIVQF